MRKVFILPNNKIKLSEIEHKAQNGFLRIDDIKQYFKIKYNDIYKYKDFTEIYCAEYHKLSDDLKGCIGEMNYILQKHKEFILNNIYKTKK